MNNSSRKKRANPFRSRDRTNFPPLDEFFEQEQQPSSNNGGYGSSPTKTDICNTSAILFNELNFSVDMSIAGKAEMAQHRYLVQKYGIDGIRHQQQGDRGSSGSPDNSKKQGARLSEGDDWDRIMDDSCTNISFSSTVIATPRPRSNDIVGYRTPSPDQSCDEDGDDDDSCTGSSFFDKSVIQSLKTPEKMRFKMGDQSEEESRVTLSRGQVHDSNDSMSSIMDDPERSTNISSTGTDFAHMFHAALRFNEDFDEQESSFFVKEEGSFSADRQSSKDKSKDKSSSVSFAADTSFATSDIRYPSNNQKRQETSFENGLKECSFASPIHKGKNEESFEDGLNEYSFASPIQKQRNDESFGTDSFKEFSLLSSSLHGQNNNESFGAGSFKEFSSLSPTPIHEQDNGGNLGSDLRFVVCQTSPSLSHRAERSISSPESPACSTPTVSLGGGHATALLNERREKIKHSPLLLGLSPIDSHVADRNLKPSSSVPFGGKHVTSLVPIERSPIGVNSSRRVRKINSQSSVPDNDDEFTKKHLFPEEDEICELSSLNLEIHDESVELVQKMPLDICCTDPTMKSEDSFLEQTLTSHLSEEVSPFSYNRTFGSNAAFRINSNVTNVRRSDRGGGTSANNDSVQREENRGNRRGVRLSRLSKLKELGLEHVLSSSQESRSELCGDSSF
mmetsp:Transcript_29732/g.54590  ORF Transcript_29732/g.54590 Transcript_29732/m.54590 type:complete len:677 (+) Transcript_29732:481-2511(+)